VVTQYNYLHSLCRMGVARGDTISSDILPTAKILYNSAHLEAEPMEYTAHTVVRLVSFTIAIQLVHFP
jgi:hypothetical protein